MDNKFIEIASVAGKNKESKKEPFRIWLSVKLADGRISIKKEEISS